MATIVWYQVEQLDCNASRRLCLNNTAVRYFISSWKRGSLDWASFASFINDTKHSTSLDDLPRQWQLARAQPTRRLDKHRLLLLLVVSGTWNTHQLNEGSRVAASQRISFFRAGSDYHSPSISA